MTPLTTPEPSADPVPLPRCSSNVELLGRVDGTGYEQPHWLVCVGGQRYIHATTRLYHALMHADGTRSIEEIARRVSDDTGDETTGEEVEWLVRNRLEPAGLVSTDRGPSQPAPVPAAPAPLLAIKHRLPLLPAKVTAPLLSVLHHLHWPPVAVLAVATAAGINGWLYFGGGLGRGLQELLQQPAWLLLVLALQLPLRTFHELGHASALRHWGVRHGVIGVALYVVIPVFYSDVTHSYRLPRRGRIQTDLGGMYFDCVSTVVLFALYALTGQQVLLLAILLVGLAMLTEFTPFMRFDGYYLLADAVGVPEPMSLFRPLLRDLLPMNWGNRRRLRLRPVARLVLLAYLAVVIAFLARPVLLIAAVGVNFLVAWLDQVLQLNLAISRAFHAGDWALLGVTLISLVSWGLTLIGLALFVSSLLRLGWKGARSAVARLRSRVS